MGTPQTPAMMNNEHHGHRQLEFITASLGIISSNITAKATSGQHRGISRGQNQRLRLSAFSRITLDLYFEILGDSIVMLFCLR